MHNYISLIKEIRDNGEKQEDRTGVGNLSLFGRQLRFDLSKGFPATTVKKLAFRSVVSELLWFLEGSSDERRLAEIQYGKKREELIGKKTIWTANADCQGKKLELTNDDLIKNLGEIYGVSWRGFGFLEYEVDQIQNTLKLLKKDKNSRRIVVSAWNPMMLNQAALPPCHYSFQFRVYNGKLNCIFNMRSCDAFLGLPFNIASYALLTHLIAHEVSLDVGELVASLADVHIYQNQLEAVDTMLELYEKNGVYDSPTLKIDYENLGNVFDEPYFGVRNFCENPDYLERNLHDAPLNVFRLDKADCFSLENYKYQKVIKSDMAV